MAQLEENGMGSREINIEPNIVPFIDLMCVCIIFLLVTAVWTQVSMIQIGSSVYAKRTESTPAEPPPRPEVPFRLDILNSGYVVNIGKRSISIPKVSGQFDDNGLLLELESIRNEYPDKKDAVISVADEMTYDDLIHGMDMLLKTDFEDISVAAGGAR